MRSSLKPIYLVLGLAGACSLVNKFDPVGDIPAAAGGSGGKGGTGGTKGGSGGEAGMSGSDVTGGTSSGGKGGKGGTSAMAEGGAAGDTGNGGDPIPGGLIVVATDVGTGTAVKHFVVLLDPADGHEIARTDTKLKVLAMAYEAAHDTWFLFTGAPGQTGGVTGPLLIGTMNTAGFEQQQSVLVPKPTNQNTVAILNQRILYRSTTHTGANLTDDSLTLLDTSTGKAAKAIGKLTIPYRYALVGSVGRANSGGTAGGRVFFLHQNIDDATENCVKTDAGTEDACTVYYSSLDLTTLDPSKLSLDASSIKPVAQVDHDGSIAALAIQPGAASNTVAVVVPPRRAIGTDASVFRYNASTGAAAGAPLTFSLNAVGQTQVDSTMPVSIATVALDPCQDLLFAGELANTKLLYAVPIGAAPGTLLAFDPQSKNGPVGSATYEPFFKTLVHYNNDPVNPTFSGFQISGTATAPQVAVRGKTLADPWKVPVGLIPLIVVAKNPEAPPCN